MGLDVLRPRLGVSIQEHLKGGRYFMADNRVVVYKGPGEVAVEDIDYPKLEVPEEVASAMGMSTEAPHAVILKIVSANICGSDQHMVRGRTTAPVGQTLGHEIAGAGPVGLAAAYSALLLGAAVVIVGDLNEERLAQARSFGCETVNVGEDAELSDQIAEIVGEPEVDCAVDAVGFEASARPGEEAPAVVLNSIQTITRAGGSLGIPGLYVTGDPGAADPDAQEGTLKIRFGLGWAKSHAFFTGQCPVMKYNRGLMMSILHDRAHIADAVNATVISLEEAPQGYKDFDKGAAKKYVINPNGYINA